MVKIHADAERCVAGGQCVLAAPEFFDQDDDDGTVVVLREDVDPGKEGMVTRAARLCPAAAIELRQ